MTTSNERSDAARASEGRRMRGAFINTAEANCSIYESGRMVYQCICDSEVYSLEYFSLDAFDVEHFSGTGRIRRLARAQADAADAMAGFDFWVFNWHPYTMEPHLSSESIARLPGLKFTVVLELAPDDPLKMVPAGVFDGYIALDPAAPATDRIFPFPRPLQGEPRESKASIRDVPVIGSFGYGTPGKGFELLVEAVNREFERALIRVNIPRGTYVGTDAIHKRDYAKYIADICEKIAKPGIDVSVTYDFMSAEELVDWCAANDLNCFMYTRSQPGLSATTDQAIMSGRPLLTLTNDTFRHIHRYIAPYPVVGMREAMETTVPAVARIQRDWSRASFNRTFHRMLAAFNLIELPTGDDRNPVLVNESPLTVMVASLRDPGGDDIHHYLTRLADCLGRSGRFRVLRIRCSSLSELEFCIEDLEPTAVILLNFSSEARGALTSALRRVAGPRIFLEANSPNPAPRSRTSDGFLVLDRRPIIPFFTVNEKLRQAPGIWLIGFAPQRSNLEAVVAKIAAEQPSARIFLEVPETKRPVFEQRISRLRQTLGPSVGVEISIADLPGPGDQLIRCLAADCIAIFYYDSERAEYLEDVSCLAMSTERPVVFTRSAPFPHYVGRETYLEDFPIAELMASGIAAHIKLLHEFGEWQMFAEIGRALLGDKIKGPSEVVESSSAKAVVTGTNTAVAATAHVIISLRDDAFLNAAYRAVLGRSPDPEGRRHYLNSLRKGASRPEILADLRQSTEGCMRGADFPGLAAIVRRHRFNRLPVLGPIARFGLRLARVNGADTNEREAARFTCEDLFALHGSAFLDAAYQAVLGRPPDDDGRRNYLDLLLRGTSRSAILAALRSSPEGRKRGPHVKGLAAIVRRQRLRQTPLLGAIVRFFGWGDDPVNAQRSLRIVENQLYRLMEARRSAAVVERIAPAEAAVVERTAPVEAVDVEHVAPVQAAVADRVLDLSNQISVHSIAAPREDEPAVHLVVGLTESKSGPVSDFTIRLAQALIGYGGPVLIVLWDASVKSLRLATVQELQQLALPTELSGRAAPYLKDPGLRVVVQKESCGKQDWLLVPEPPGTSEGLSEFTEMNLILEAKRLGLRCAFVFHGADTLRLPIFAGAAAKAHEQYMQALLLADVVMPVSSPATADLNDFFVQHQLSDVVPLIRKIPFPAAARTNERTQWARFATRVRGLLTDAANASRQLRSLYFLIDPIAPSSVAQGFRRRFARVLADRGINIIPASWDAGAQQLVAVDPVRIKSPEFGESTRPWSPWISLESPDAPRWLLFPNGVHIDAFADLSIFAAQHRLRIAAILHETIEPVESRKLGHNGSARDRAEFEALMRFDKVFAVSAGRYADFYRFLLSRRDRVHSAEHRFKAVAQPSDVDGLVRRTTPKPANQGIVRVVIWFSVGHAIDPRTVFDAAARAAERSTDRLLFTFVVSPLDIRDSQIEDIRSRVGDMPQARWVIEEADDAQNRDLLEDADFTIFSGPGGQRASQVTTSLWHGLPCLVHDDDDDGPTASGPGLVWVDMRNRDRLTKAILELTVPDWRRSLAIQALSRPTRSWDAYAAEVAAELAMDRLTDGQLAPDGACGPDVYATLTNLSRRPKLSLCISTYNRERWLVVSLRSIFSQIPEERADLEVLVVDNASTDNTSEAVTQYLTRIDFRYVRNPRNVGMLGNLAVTSQSARGEYIWILGDDDLTRPGIIERTLQIIEERPGIGLIYFNYGYTSEPDSRSASDLTSFLANYNILEPAGPDVFAPVKLLAAKCENFYSAIYSHAYRRDHAMRAYCQNTSDRIFSTMVSCIPSTYYVLNYMAELPAYWVGEPSLVVNSNVSWADYGTLLDLEQLPRAWDLAERVGTPPSEVDRRRANRLWLMEMMWRDIFENDKAGNSAYFSAPRVLMRIKHLQEIDKYIGEFRAIYQRAYDAGNPAARLPPSELFSAFAPDQPSK